ncbi:DinB family protein [Bacillus spongiae]|uniref:DinB family protein n=1 Tax=Bacillus spongiae TaxID=2683610 RepID=A0ABU8HCF3_9BACI
MFQSINNFLKTWEYEAGATHRLLTNLTEESLQQESTNEHWSVGEIAWHLVSSIKIITSNTDLQFEGPGKGSPLPESVEKIANSYLQVSVAFVHALQTQWSDDQLEKRIDFFGQKMKKGTLLLFLLQHQTHHRGQLTILMRQAGLRVHGIYGPSLEEWAQFGMEPPKV